MLSPTEKADKTGRVGLRIIMCGGVFILTLPILWPFWVFLISIYAGWFLPT